MSSSHRRTPRPVNRRRQTSWASYLLPAAGAVAVLLMVGIIALILTTGDDDDNGDDEASLADATETPTPMATAPDEGVAQEASPTPEAETPAETAVEDTTASPEETPEPEEEAEPTPAPEPTLEPQPTPVPLVGDFGELPPGDMPSGSPADAMNLEYHLNMSLQALPAQASAYQLQHRVWSIEEVQGVAERLGIDGEVVDQGNGSFGVEGSSSSLYVTGGSTQYLQTPANEGLPALPANEQLTQMARSWMTENGLVGANIGPGQVLDRNEEASQAYVQIKPVEPSNIISATPSAGITILGDGTVVEAMINWPGALQGSTYGLQAADQLWNQATQGRGFVDINVNNLPADFQGRSGTVTATSASIAYTIAGSPQGTQFLVPVAVFSGTATIDEAGGPVPVDIYVEAISAQASPRG